MYWTVLIQGPDIEPSLLLTLFIGLYICLLLGHAVVVYEQVLVYVHLAGTAIRNGHF